MIQLWGHEREDLLNEYEYQTWGQPSSWTCQINKEYTLED